MSRKPDDRTKKGPVEDAQKDDERKEQRNPAPVKDDTYDEALKSGAITEKEVDASFERFLNRQVITGEEDGALELVGSAEDTLGMLIEELLIDEDLSALAKRAKLSPAQLASLRTSASYVDLDDPRSAASALAASHAVPASALLTLMNTAKARRESEDGPSLLQAARKRPQ